MPKRKSAELIDAAADVSSSVSTTTTPAVRRRRRNPAAADAAAAADSSSLSATLSLFANGLAATNPASDDGDDPATEGAMKRDSGAATPPDLAATVAIAAAPPRGALSSSVAAARKGRAASPPLPLSAASAAGSSNGGGGAVVGSGPAVPPIMLPPSSSSSPVPMTVPVEGMLSVLASTTTSGIDALPTLGAFGSGGPPALPQLPSSSSASASAAAAAAAPSTPLAILRAEIDPDFRHLDLDSLPHAMYGTIGNILDGSCTPKKSLEDRMFDYFLAILQYTTKFKQIKEALKNAVILINEKLHKNRKSNDDLAAQHQTYRPGGGVAPQTTVSTKRRSLAASGDRARTQQQQQHQQQRQIPYTDDDEDAEEDDDEEDEYDDETGDNDALVAGDNHRTVRRSGGSGSKLPPRRSQHGGSSGSIRNSSTNVVAGTSSAASSANERQTDYQKNAQYRTMSQCLMYYLIHVYLHAIRPASHPHPNTILSHQLNANGYGGMGLTTATASGSRKKGSSATVVMGDTNRGRSKVTSVYKRSRNMATNVVWGLAAMKTRVQYMMQMVQHFYGMYSDSVLDKYSQAGEKQTVSPYTLINQRLYRSILLELDLTAVFRYLQMTLNLCNNFSPYALREFMRFCTPQIIKHSQYDSKQQYGDVVIDALHDCHYDMAVEIMYRISESLKYREPLIEISTSTIKLLSMNKFNEYAQNIRNMFKYVQDENQSSELTGVCMRATTGNQNLSNFYLILFKSKNLIFDCIDHPSYKIDDFRRLSWEERLQSIRDYFTMPIVRLSPISDIEILTGAYKEPQKTVYVTLVGLDRSRIVFVDHKTRPITQRFSKVTPSDLRGNPRTSELLHATTPMYTAHSNVQPGGAASVTGNGHVEVGAGQQVPSKAGSFSVASPPALNYPQQQHQQHQQHHQFYSQQNNPQQSCRQPQQHRKQVSQLPNVRPLSGSNFRYSSNQF